MKQYRMLWIFCSCLLLLISCKESSQSVNMLQAGNDSLDISVEDSSHFLDPWIKYSYTERQGKSLFEQYCVICHGESGEGDGFNAYNLDPRPRSFIDSAYMKALSIENLIEIINYGGKGSNKSVLMPAYKSTLSKSQTSNIVAYIVTFTSGR